MLSAEVLEGVQSVWAVVSAAPHPQALRAAHRCGALHSYYLSAVGHKQQLLGLVYFKLDVSCEFKCNMQ